MFAYPIDKVLNTLFVSFDQSRPKLFIATTVQLWRFSQVRWVWLRWPSTSSSRCRLSSTKELYIYCLYTHNNCYFMRPTAVVKESKLSTGTIKHQPILPPSADGNRQHLVEFMRKLTEYMEVDAAISSAIGSCSCLYSRA